MGHTWAGLKKELGLHDFSPESQEIAAVALLDRRGALEEIESGKADSRTLDKLAPEWASIIMSDGAGYYSGQGTPEGAQAVMLAKYRNGVATAKSTTPATTLRDNVRNKGYQATYAVYRPDTTTRSAGPTIRVRTVSDDNPINVEPDWSIGSTDTSSQAGFTSPDTGTNNFSDPGTDYLNMVAQTLGLTNLGIPGFGGGQNTNAFVQPSFGNSITTNNIWGTPQYNVYNPYGQYNQAYNPPSYTNFNQGNNFTQPSPANDGIRSIVASVIRSVVGRLLNPKGQSDWNSRPQGNGNNFLN
jgi:hypothetical protein